MGQYNQGARAASVELKQNSTEAARAPRLHRANAADSVEFVMKFCSYLYQTLLYVYIMEEAQAHRQWLQNFFIPRKKPHTSLLRSKNFLNTKGWTGVSLVSAMIVLIVNIV